MKNNSTISAIGNEFYYEQVFTLELRAISKPQDIIIGITTSSNSPNMLAAFQVAKKLYRLDAVLTPRGSDELF